MPVVNDRDPKEIAAIRRIADGDDDMPVLMLNLNRYTEDAKFPNGSLYQNYMSVLETFLPVVGAKVLWRHPIFGQPIGDQRVDEVLAAWYPTHRAFLDLRNSAGADENFRLRGLAVEYAVIHRCPGSVFPFSPTAKR